MAFASTSKRLGGVSEAPELTINNSSNSDNNSNANTSSNTNDDSNLIIVINIML